MERKSKTEIKTILNSNCDQTLKRNWQQNSKNKSSNSDNEKNQGLKLCQNSNATI